MDDFERLHAGYAGHAQVHEDQVKICGLNEGQSLFPIFRSSHFKTCLLQDACQGLADRRLVINDQDISSSAQFLSLLSIGSQTLNRAPSCGLFSAVICP